jgi:hypothetical protein
LSKTGHSNPSFKRLKTKVDWYGVGIQDAFKSGLPYHYKQTAQRLFYRKLREDQREVAKLFSGASGSATQLKARPQLGPVYTSFPSLLASLASIGLTALVEYKLRKPSLLLMSRMKSYLDNPAQVDGVSSHRKAYKYLAEQTAAAVDARLLIHDLAQIPSIKIYRLFTSALQSLRFECVPELIFAGVLFGDLWPEIDKDRIHPLSREILIKIIGISQTYLQQLNQIPSWFLLDLGVAWVRQICQNLAEFLPLINTKDDKNPNLPEKFDDNFSFEDDPCGPEPAPDNLQELGGEIAIPPLDQPNPPSLHPNQSLYGLINKVTKGDSDLGPSPIDHQHQQNLLPEDFDKSMHDYIKNLCATIEAVSAQYGDLDDIRHDLLETILADTAFGEGPLQGGQEEGHEVAVSLGGQTRMGAIFDKPLEPGDDCEEYEQIIKDALPITEALRKSLFPGLDSHAEPERFRASGELDPRRLAVARFSEACYRRYRQTLEPGKNGSPLLVIAADASGSLDSKRMRMLKVLSIAWLHGIERSNVKILAGIYHSGRIHDGVDQALVQWLHHPRKTPAFNTLESSINIASLPRTGTGGQRDALSLAFIMDEAKVVAEGKNIYLTIITDTVWNKSFDGPETSSDEVHACLSKIRKNFGLKLHVTLVILGKGGKTGMEDVVDHQIMVPGRELSDYARVAEKIPEYQSSLIRDGCAGRGKI